jgi:hypothetical protein
LAAEDTRPDLTGLTEQQKATAQEQWVAKWAGPPLALDADRAEWWKQVKKQHGKLVKAARRSGPTLPHAHTFAAQLSASLALTPHERAQKRKAAGVPDDRAAQCAARAARVAKVKKDGRTLYEADLTEADLKENSQEYGKLVVGNRDTPLYIFYESFPHECQRWVLTSHLSRLTCHVSPLTSHLSPLTSHLSPLT